tara:strand:+ start:9509 stop:10291 length:783 start_codon:yes stop_codon:yes gene_type:complete
MKKLIVGGCSFTYEDWCWPEQVYKELKKIPSFNDLELVNVAMGSNGNDLIKKSIVAQVEKELKTTKPEDITVGVMWSGPDRWSFHSEDKLDANDWGKNGIVDNIHNPRSIVENFNKWYFINAFWDNEHSLLYYSTFHSNIGSIINTLECIIFLQLYLESKHIQYFMTTYLDIFNPLDFDLDIKNHPETGYLYQNINFNKFLPVDGCYEYLKKNYPEGIPIGKDNHPFKSGHKYFAKNAILPFMLKNNLIDNYSVQPRKLI